MKRFSPVVLTAMSLMLVTANVSYARHEDHGGGGGNNPQQEQARAAENQSRANAEQAARQQEENARRQQDDSRRQQEAAQRQQEQQGRQQQQAQRQQQEQMAKQQQEQQRQQQQQMQRQQEQASRQQQEEQRRQQEQMAKQQQDQQRQQQQQASRQQQEMAREQQQQASRQQQEMAREQQQVGRQQQERGQQPQARGQQEMSREPQQRDQQRQLQTQEREQQEMSREPQQRDQQRQLQTQEREQGRNEPPIAREPQNEERQRGGEQRTAMTTPERSNMFGASRPSNTSFNPQNVRTRPAQPRPLDVSRIQNNKAISMPYLEGRIGAAEQEHADQVTRNLQEHLVPVAANFAPPEVAQVTTYSMQSYLDNYNTFVNNQPIIINSSNTFCNPVPQYQYPSWYRPEPGWIYSNGFCLGNEYRENMDWLGYGWHPYYGPPPEGFICANNFEPTPWIYVPAYGLWRQPGISGWAPYGPPYDYTGPITVEVLEPRRIESIDPYTGGTHSTTMNVMYLYNAFYYPATEHWGYMNRHRYFVWLNV